MLYAQNGAVQEGFSGLLLQKGAFVKLPPDPEGEWGLLGASEALPPKRGRGAQHPAFYSPPLGEGSGVGAVSPYPLS